MSERRRVRLSDENCLYVWVGMVSGALAEDLAYFAAHPRQLERLRRVAEEEREAGGMPAGTTHVMSYVGYEGHHGRVALRRSDGGSR